MHHGNMHWLGRSLEESRDFNLRDSRLILGDSSNLAIEVIKEFSIYSSLKKRTFLSLLSEEIIGK